MVEGRAGPVLTPSLGASQGPDGLIRQLEPFPKPVVGQVATTGPSVNGLLGGAARPVAPSACIGLAPEDEVGVRDTGPVSTGDIPVGL